MLVNGFYYKENHNGVFVPYRADSICVAFGHKFDTDAPVWECVDCKMSYDTYKANVLDALPVKEN